MNFAQRDAEILQQMEQTLELRRQEPSWQTWDRIPLGPISLAEACLYRSAEMIYGEIWERELSLNKKKRSWPRRVWQALEKGQWDQRALRGALENNCPQAIQTWDRFRFSPGPSHPTEGAIGVAGFLNPSGPAFRITLQQLRDRGITSGSPPRTARALERARHLARNSAPWCYPLAVEFFSTEDWLHTHQPELLIIPDERQILGRALAALARARRIRCLSVGHLHEMLLGRVPFLQPTLSLAHTVPHSALGQALNRLGRTTRPIVATSFDDEVGLVFERRPPASPPLILYCSQALPGETQRIRELAEVLSPLPCQFQVRPHPKQSRSWLGRRLGRIDLQPPLPLCDALLQSRVVVAHSSSVAWTAAELGRPAVIYSQAPELLPLLFQRGFVWAQTPEQAREALREQLSSPLPPPPVPEHRRPFAEWLEKLLKPSTDKGKKPQALVRTRYDQPAPA